MKSCIDGFRGTSRSYVSRAFTLIEVLIVLVVLGIIGAVVFSSISDPKPQITLTTHAGTFTTAKQNDILIINGPRPGVTKPVHDLAPGNYIVAVPANYTAEKFFGLMSVHENKTIVWFSQDDMNQFGKDYLFFLIRTDSEEYKALQQPKYHTPPEG